MNRRIAAPALSLLFAFVALPALRSAASTNVLYGGPSYVFFESENGYGDGWLPNPGQSAGNGMAIGAVMHYQAGRENGTRAVRWDASQTIVELDHLGTSSRGSTSSYAFAMNMSGTSVGFATKYEDGIRKGDRAVRWSATGTAAVELGHLGTIDGGQTYSQAWAINEAGTAVGYAGKPDASNGLSFRAVRWDASGTEATELEHIDTQINGIVFAVAYGINASNTAIGHMEMYEASTNLGRRPLRWSGTDNTVSELGTLGTTSSGMTTSEPRAINDAGTTVGFSNKYVSGISKGSRAVKWDASGTEAIELGHLGLSNSGHTAGEARDINNAGTIVGHLTKYESGLDKGRRAVRWDATGTDATELGHLGLDPDGITSSYASAINGLGITVGNAVVHDQPDTLPDQRAVAWGADGIAIDLNRFIEPDTGWLVLTRAIHISKTNWITGYGLFDPDDAGPLLPYRRMFLLDASSLIPEPASALWLAIGTLLVTSRSRRHSA